MRICILVSVVICCLSISVAADQIRPMDFAYGLSVEVDRDGAIYKFSLPLSVYENITRPDLGDMRVFNSSNEIVPHIILKQEKKRIEETAPLTLGFFPLYYGKDNKPAALSLHITTDSRGAIVDINRGEVRQGRAVVSGYLLDCSALKKPPDRLKLDWTSKTDSFVTKVTVEASNDLNHWSRIVAGATLANLTYGDHSLKQSTIDIPRFNGKYLRLSWPAGRQSARLTDIKALFPSSVPEQPRQWINITPTHLEDQPGDYFFETKGYMPADRIKIHLPQRNTLIKVTLKSRTGPEADWHIHHKGLLYNLRVKGASLTEDTIKLPPTTNRYWLLHVELSGGGIGAGMPVIEMGWVPHELVFVARGEPPYRLAYGSARVEPEPSQMNSLLGELRQKEDEHFIKTARVGGVIDLGGKKMLEKKSTLPWKQWILWAILVVGVAIIGWMAWRLYGQINASDQTDT